MTAQDTKSRLLDTALQLIWQSNYESVGVNEICRQAGVTKGGFYHHFESKASLFIAASDAYWQSVKVDLDRLMSPSVAPLDQLENFIDYIFDKKIGRDECSIGGCPSFSAGLQAGCNDPEVLESLCTMATNSAKYSLALVHNLRSAEALVPNVDSERAARMLNQYLQGLAPYARTSASLDRPKLRRDVREAVYRLLDVRRELWQPEANAT